VFSHTAEMSWNTNIGRQMEHDIAAAVIRTMACYWPCCVYPQGNRPPGKLKALRIKSPLN